MKQLFILCLISLISCQKIANEPQERIEEIDFFHPVKQTVSIPDARPVRPVSFNKKDATVMITFSKQYINSSWYGGLDSVNAANLTLAQQARVIQKIRQAVQEWKLNIVEEKDMAFYNSVNAFRKMKTHINSSDDRYIGAGGHTWRGSLFWGDGTPNFVYAPVMQNNPEWVADAAIHEIGHAIGLRHQEQYDSNCVRVNTYRHGVWMGDPTTVPFAVWYYGTTIDCNTYQDDVLFLNEKLGRR